MLKRTTWFVIACATVVCIALSTALQEPSEAASEEAVRINCSVPSLQSISQKDTVIDSASQIDQPVPFCKIVGHVNASDPASSINFTLSLPEGGWNGRYYFMGLGGAAGYMPQANPKLLGAGFAVAVTDTGHQGQILDWHFAYHNPTPLLDYAYRAAHLVAVATQTIAKSYYNAASMHRYMLGCSGGGRMSEQEAERYPNDFDGYVIGAPGLGWDPTWFAWTSQQELRNADAWVSPAKLAILEAAVKAACAGPDGLVRDPDACGFDPSRLRCRSKKNTSACLTGEEIQTVNAIRRGPPTVFPGHPAHGFAITNPTGWATFFSGMNKPTPGQANPWAPSPPPAGFIIAHSFLRDMFIDDANYDFTKQLDWNNPKDRARLAAGYERADISGRHPEKLAALQKAGGKIIYWQGISDPGIPISLIITHYESLEKSVPDAHNFARLFLVPGTYHCGGGTGPQDTADRALEKIIAWVERGTPPDSIIASSPSYPEGLPSGMPGAPDPKAMVPPTRTVLLCAYPQVADFEGRKEDFAYDESNWECKSH